MYTLEALRRKIAKEGKDITIRYLLSDNLPLSIREALEEAGVFHNGVLRYELL